MDADNIGDTVLSECVDNVERIFRENEDNDQNSKKPAYESGANIAGRPSVQPVRPYAVIGPDRIDPPANGPPYTTYSKRHQSDMWQFPENVYRQSAQYPVDYDNASGNISPRQTFQENMPRVMVPLRYGSAKLTQESYPSDTNTVPPYKSLNDPKYCEVPYTITPLTNEDKKRNSDVSVNNVNPTYIRGPPQFPWPNGNIPGIQHPCGIGDQYPYQDYPGAPHAAPPMAQIQHPSIGERLHQPQYIRSENFRYEPYPTPKDRYGQGRFDYVNTHLNPYQQCLPNSKYDLQKLTPHPYSGPSYRDPILDGYQRNPKNQVNLNVPYHSQGIHPKCSPISGSYAQNKYFSYPNHYTNIPGHLPKPPPDPNKKIFLANQYHMSENYYNNDYPRSNNPKNAMFTNFPPNISGFPYYKKDMMSANMHLKNIDHYYNNPPKNLLHYPPNLVQSDTHNFDVNFGAPNGDFMHAGHAPLPNIRNLDPNYALYNRYLHNARPIRDIPKRDLSKQSSDKKGLDVRQFLKNWSEIDDENDSKEITLHPTDNVVRQSEVIDNPEQLYVLGLVKVPHEELSKYDHIQKVSKLPDNIKGFTSIELLNQFEEAIESTKHSSVPTENSSRDLPFHANPRSVPNIRSLSPLDVEAKISQSIIHKDVGCNFEIRPCSPQVLSVENAAPAPITKERIIEKVMNPLVDRALVNNDGIFSKRKDRRRQSHVLGETISSSCKLIKTHTTDNESNTINSSYSLHDLESNAGVCLASLPRLDNDIELNFPEVNQQFIDANKGDNIKTDNDIKNNQSIFQEELKELPCKNPVRTDSVIKSHSITPSSEMHETNFQSTEMHQYNPNLLQNISKSVGDDKAIEHININCNSSLERDNTVTDLPSKCQNVTESENLATETKDHYQENQYNPNLNNISKSVDNNLSIEYDNPSCNISLINKQTETDLQAEYQNITETENPTSDTEYQCPEQQYDPNQNKNSYSVTNNLSIEHINRNCKTNSESGKIDTVLPSEYGSVTEYKNLIKLTKDQYQEHQYNPNRNNISQSEDNKATIEHCKGIPDLPSEYDINVCNEENRTNEPGDHKTKLNDIPILDDNNSSVDLSINNYESSVERGKIVTDTSSKCLNFTEKENNTKTKDNEEPQIDTHALNFTCNSDKSVDWNIPEKNNETVSDSISEYGNNTREKKVISEVNNYEYIESNNVESVHDISTPCNLSKNYITGEHKFENQMNTAKKILIKGSEAQTVTSPNTDSQLNTIEISSTKILCDMKSYDFVKNKNDCETADFEKMFIKNDSNELCKYESAKGDVNEERPINELTFEENRSKSCANVEKHIEDASDVSGKYGIPLNDINKQDNNNFDTPEKEISLKNKCKYLTDSEFLQKKIGKITYDDCVATDILKKTTIQHGNVVLPFKRLFSNIVQNLLLHTEGFFSHSFLNSIKRESILNETEDPVEEDTHFGMVTKANLAFDISVNATTIIRDNSNNMECNKGNVINKEVVQMNENEIIDEKPSQFFPCKNKIQLASSKSINDVSTGVIDHIENYLNKSINVENELMGIDLNIKRKNLLKKSYSESSIFGKNEVKQQLCGSFSSRYQNVGLPSLFCYTQENISNDHMNILSQNENFKYSDIYISTGSIKSLDSIVSEDDPMTVSTELQFCNEISENWIDDVACVETVVSNESVKENDLNPVLASVSLSRDPSCGIELNTSSGLDDFETKIHQLFGEELSHLDSSNVSNMALTYYNESQSNDDMENNNYTSHESFKTASNIDDFFENSIDKMYMSPQANYIEGSFDHTKENDHISLQSSVEYNNLKKINEYESLLSQKRFSSSPEVSSTTSEEKRSGIRLKITNHNGERSSHISDIQSNISRCKFTEKEVFSNRKTDSKLTRKLITKAAQKYIPPLKETINDLKISLHLPAQSLARLKELKDSKDRPKISSVVKRAPPNKSCSKQIISKKIKPNFDEVLKSIEEIQMNKQKEKKNKNCVPRVIIKKNGSNYMSKRKDPDLTGRKWQPWIFLEKNNFIDKMALRGKKKAIYCYRKQSYILFEKFKKYRSEPQKKFVISTLDTEIYRPSLKYTIKLK